MKTSLAPAKLPAVWKLVKWLDNAWWSQELPETEGLLTKWPAFRSLAPDKRLLTHWLCYIFERGQPSLRLWQGVPIFAEICSEYQSFVCDSAQLVERFTQRTKGKVAKFVAKQHSSPNGAVELVPRFDERLAVTSTLFILKAFKRNIASYLGHHWEFVIQDDPSDATRRLAFLLDILTYRKEPNGSSGDLRHESRFRADAMLGLLEAPSREYESWMKSDIRFNRKRLWAALRDWLVPGGNSHSTLRTSLEASFEAISRPDIVKYIGDHTDKMLSGLELPGDVWNLRFFEDMFGRDAKGNARRRLRDWHDDLQKEGQLEPGHDVVQFDVTYAYSPRMCERLAFGSCVFRANSRIWGLCPPRAHIEWKGRFCPVTDHLCGFEYRCNPIGCPVCEAVPRDLCDPGCQPDVTWNRGDFEHEV
jgi:hypothetical protein